MQKEGRVPLNEDVMMKCMCGMCPVQAESACSRPKIKMMTDMRAGEGMMDPEPSDLAGPYCSIGVAACNDLDTNKTCICRQCQVYKDFTLTQAKPIEHFCFNGNAI